MHNCTGHSLQFVSRGACAAGARHALSLRFGSRPEDGSGCFLALALTQLTSDSQAAVARAILATFKLVVFVSTLPGLAVGVDARAGGWG